MADIRENAPTKVELGNLVSAIEIAQRCEVAPVTVRKWRDRYPTTFPKPVIAFATGPLWYWPEIDEWLKIPRPAGRRGTWDRIQARA